MEFLFARLATGALFQIKCGFGKDASLAGAPASALSQTNHFERG
jgi:hypothetical protein